MNRQQRRALMQNIRRSNKLTKKQAKEYVNTNFLGYRFAVGDKAKMDYQKMIRHRLWNYQEEGFRAWVEAHKDEVFTIAEVKEGYSNVTFEEDDTDPKWEFRTESLIPVASATIKLDDGTEKKVVLDGVTDANDPSIMEKVNEAMEDVGDMEEK